MWAGGFSFVMGILGIHGGKKKCFCKCDIYSSGWLVPVGYILFLW
jgi:hypothetical protein